MSRAETLGSSHPSKYANGHQHITPQSPGGRILTLLAYAMAGWVGLGGIVLLLASVV